MPNEQRVLEAQKFLQNQGVPVTNENVSRVLPHLARSNTFNERTRGGSSVRPTNNEISLFSLMDELVSGEDILPSNEVGSSSSQQVTNAVDGLPAASITPTNDVSSLASNVGSAGDPSPVQIPNERPIRNTPISNEQNNASTGGIELDPTDEIIALLGVASKGGLDQITEQRKPRIRGPQDLKQLEDLRPIDDSINRSLVEGDNAKVGQAIEVDDKEFKITDDGNVLNETDSLVEKRPGVLERIATKLKELGSEELAIKVLRAIK